MIVPSQRPGGRQPPPPSRKVGLIIWGALLAGVLLFAGVASAVGPGMHRRPNLEMERLGELFLYLTGGLSAVMLLVSTVLPARMRGPAPGVSPDAVALSRTIVAAALNEGPALFALVAWMTTGNPWLFAPFGLSILGLLLAFPSQARWARLGGAPPPGAPRNRLVR